MTSATLAAATTDLASLDLERLADEARSFVASSRAPSTMRAYRSDWRHFDAWAAVRGLEALPAAPATVALYVTDLASWAAVATIGRRLASITQAHGAADLESPVAHLLVRSTMQGIRRSLGTAQASKTPALVADVKRMVAALPDGLLGDRDRALLLVGFAGAFRRSELVALSVEDLADTADGLIVTIRRSKTDQEGAGRTVGIPYGSDPASCPVRAVRAWLASGGISDGALFRSVTRHGHLGARLSDKAVASVVKRSTERVGLDPARYAGHSLRSGLATSAAHAGASERSIMAQTGHRSTAMVRRYIRDGSLFRENAAATVGL